MLVSKVWVVFFSLLTTTLVTHISSAQDSGQGATLYQQQCGGCHSVEPNMHLAGPSLWGVVGRKAGSSAGANYSTALKNADILWDSETLDEFLAAPSEFVPGTTKVVAVPDNQQRIDLIEYLKTLTD